MHEQFKDAFPKFYQHLQGHQTKFIEQVLPGASESDLKKLEEDLGLALPETYKNFLRCARGFMLRGGAIQFTAGHPFFHRFPTLDQLSAGQLKVIKVKGGTWPPPSQGMLCFAEFYLEADGDQVLFDVSQGLQNGEYPIMYYAHECRPASVRKLSDSFSHWMDEFLDYDEWN